MTASISYVSIINAPTVPRTWHGRGVRARGRGYGVTWIGTVEAALERPLRACTRTSAATGAAVTYFRWRTP